MSLCLLPKPKESPYCQGVFLLTLWEDDYAPPGTGLIKTLEKAKSITQHNQEGFAGFRPLTLDYGRNLSGQRFPAAIVSCWDEEPAVKSS